MLTAELKKWLLRNKLIACKNKFIFSYYPNVNSSVEKALFGIIKNKNPNEVRNG
jgi:hypothetical protein